MNKLKSNLNMSTSEQKVLSPQTSAEPSRWWGVLSHVAVFVVGALALFASAFHGSIWFDESYSIAIASHSFADIWSIGSADVHPVLYYWCLHVLYLIFGSNILVYRLFSVCGVVLCALLGLTHIRHDFGARAGMLFTVFVVLSPCVSLLGLQIRMYGWAAFAVGLACIYALRIYRTVRSRAADTAEVICGDADGEGGADNTDSANGDGDANAENDAAANRASTAVNTHVHISWWVILFIASLAAAYFHYYATIAAFMINVLLLVGLIIYRRVCKRELVILIVEAIVLVALFVPWLTALVGQISYVANDFWISFDIPESLVELIGFPAVSSLVWDVLEGDYGIVMQVVAAIVVIYVVVFAAYLIIRAIINTITHHAYHLPRLPDEQLKQSEFVCGQCDSGEQSLDRQNLDAQDPGGRDLSSWVAPFAVYVGMIVITIVIGALLDQVILYSRYLFVAVAPFLLALAILCARKNSIAVTTNMLIGALVLACLNYGILTYIDYSDSNDEPIAYYEQTVAHAQEENGNGESLVVSGDIGIAGVLAVTCPDIEQVYLDVYKTREAYEAYEPTLEIVDSLNETVENFSGYFVWLSTSAQRTDAQEFASQYDAQIVEWQTFYRPYNDIDFTIVLMKR